MAYPGAVAVGLTSNFLWSEVLIVAGHVAPAATLRSRSADLSGKDALVSFYMFLWKVVEKKKNKLNDESFQEEKQARYKRLKNAATNKPITPNEASFDVVDVMRFVAQEESQHHMEETMLRMMDVVKERCGDISPSDLFRQRGPDPDGASGSFLGGPIATR